MREPSLLVLITLCSCGIDDREVRVEAVDGACVEPRAGGLLVDFSGAMARTCPPGICSSDLVGMPMVSLAVAERSGVIFPYGSSAVAPFALGLLPTGQALRAAVESRPPHEDAPDGFALRFLECVDTSAYSGVSFTLDGDLGSCPLRFALQFIEGDAGTFGALCSIDECSSAQSVLVSPGATTLSFGEDPTARGAALAGMQWELTVPGEAPEGCSADVTIDDIELVSAR